MAQLITHSSGIAPDSTQGLLGLLRDMHKTLGARVTATALARTPFEKQGYFYNNENYAILGEMVAVAVGQTYQEACSARVLDPAGIHSAQVSRSMGVHWLGVVGRCRCATMQSSTHIGSGLMDLMAMARQRYCALIWEVVHSTVWACLNAGGMAPAISGTSDHGAYRFGLMQAHLR